jgi:membrane fusion protein, peptide pheromone/bacteriocin exporter
MPDSTSHILNDPDLRNTVIGFSSKPRLFSHSIYLIIVGFLMLLSIGMAFFKIPVYIRTRGILRPSSEVNQILAPVQGIVDKIYVSENQLVNEGDPIIRLESEKENLQKGLIVAELNLLSEWVQDLITITDTNNVSFNLVTDKYQIDYQLYNEQIQNIDFKLDLAKTDYLRFQNLFNEKYISEKEFDESVLKYISLMTEKKLLITGKKKQWINELNEFKLKETGLVKQISEIGFFIDKSIITAPSSGIIQSIRTKYKGEFCSTGTLMCKLIPNTNLVAEIFIPPKDIGFIRRGQNVRLLIDSYDYKYWGGLKASCSSISEDVEIIENQALFRVICDLQPPACLEFRQKKVSPGKGMTLTAQFLVEEKNVWQLLWDDSFNLISIEPEKKNE